jgi:6-phosphogluconolactonase (cycloisomerase 2 family)
VSVENITTSGGAIQGFLIGPTGTLTELPGSPVLVEGLPVSLAMHPSGKFIFAATPSIAVLDRDADTGMLTLRSVFGTPKQQLTLNSSGSLLMANERDTNEISRFAVDEAGNIAETFADRQEANIPDGVAFDPTGRFVFKTSVADGTVASFVLDRDTGKLTPIGRPIATGGHAVSITVVQPH